MVTHVEETRAVKQALQKTYPDVKVKHGQGTGCGWLKIYAAVKKPATCTCEPGNDWFRCDRCRESYDAHYRTIHQIARSAAGRSGEDARIMVVISTVPSD